MIIGGLNGVNSRHVFKVADRVLTAAFEWIRAVKMF
jgi:hypothetical protein